MADLRKQGLVRGLLSYKEAHKVLVQHKLYTYFIWPGLFSILYASLFLWAANALADSISMEASSYPDWLSWLGDFTSWFLNSVYWVAAIWLFFTSSKIMLLALMAPVLTKLSETVEKKVAGRQPPKVGIKEYIEDIRRALQISLRNLIYETAFILVLGWIPMVGWIIAFGVSSFYAGYGYIDYTLERKRYTVPDSIKFMRAHRGLCLGLGIPYMAGMLVIVLGWFVMPIYTTIAATLEVMEITEGEASPNAGGVNADKEGLNLI